MAPTKDAPATSACGTSTPRGMRTPTGGRLHCTEPPGHTADPGSAHGAPAGRTGWFTWTD